MIKPIIVIGGGGHAKVLIETLLMYNTKLIGITDEDVNRKGELILGIPIIGSDEIIKQYSPDSINLVNGLGSVKTTKRRKKIYEEYKKLGYKFASVIHPSAIIASDIKLGEGVQIMAGVIVQPGSCINDNSIINTKSSIDHDCHIGSHVHIAPGVTTSGSVSIEDGVHIGAGSTIIQGVHIGKDSLIGAGSVVLKDIPESKIVTGVPAKIRNY